MKILFVDDEEVVLEIYVLLYLILLKGLNFYNKIDTTFVLQIIDREIE